MADDDVKLHCHGCGAVMERISTEEECKTGPRVDVYQCGTQDCRRKIDIIFEPLGGLSESQKTWVEREVARSGAFFPQDHHVGGFRGPGLR